MIRAHLTPAGRWLLEDEVSGLYQSITELEMQSLVDDIKTSLMRQTKNEKD